MTRNNKEIDFYIPKEKLLIETTVKVEEEHVEKLFKAMKELNLNTSTLITFEEKGERIKKVEGTLLKVEIKPIVEFLLGI